MSFQRLVCRALPGMAAPPAWLLAALAAPHVFALLPLLAPRQLAVVAAQLGHTDAAVPYTAGSLVLGAGQAGAVLQWFMEARGDEALRGGVPFAARAALAAPLIFSGVVLKLGVARALRPRGVYFGRQLGAQGAASPLSTAWPYSLTAHPDYLGSALLLTGVYILLGAAAPEGGATALAVWLGLYLASAMFEEAFACAGQPPPVLKPGQNPFWNNMARPEVRLLRATHAAVAAPRSVEADARQRNVR